MKIPGIPYHQGKNNYKDRDGKKYGFAIHNTSNSAPATNESIYADHRTDGVSSHFYVDNKQVIQSLDTNSSAGHAGSYEGNEHAIAFEVTGTNDKSREWWLNNVAWDKFAQVIAYILKNDPDYKNFEIRRASVSEMKTNPHVRAFYGHNDMRLAWGGTTHTDPGPNFPWDKLIASVKTAMGAPTKPETKAPEVTTGSDDDLFCKYGEKNDKVKFLQYQLKNLGFDPGAIDGAFGDQTKTALIKACKAVYPQTTVDGLYFGPAAKIYVDTLWVRNNAPAAQPAAGVSLPANVTITGTIKAS